jgi:hypothetical protein
MAPLAGMSRCYAPRVKRHNRGATPFG